MTLLASAELPGPFFRALVRQWLSKEDRLQLFGSSRALAAGVMQQSSRVQLQLSIQQEQAVSTKHLQARLPTLISILDWAPEPCLKVSLNGGVPAGWDSLPLHRITHLQLNEITLTSRTLWHSLKLQACTQLQRLTLGRGARAMLSSDAMEALAQQRMEWAPTSLSCLEVSPSCSISCAQVMVALLSPQLTRLTLQKQLQLVPEQLPLLTYFSTSEYLSDSLMDTLSSMPRLSHVTVFDLDLGRDHRRQQLNWEQLQLTRGAFAWNLHYLPVQSIRHLIIHDNIECFIPDQHAAQRVVAHVAASPHLHCVPGTRRLAKLGLPLFTLLGHCAPGLLSLCSHALTETAGLYVHWVSPSSIPQFLPCLPRLSAKATLLCLALTEPVGAQPQQQVEQQAQQPVQGQQSVQAQQSAQAQQPEQGAQLVLSQQSEHEQQSLQDQHQLQEQQPVPDQQQQVQGQQHIQGQGGQQQQQGVDLQARSVWQQVVSALPRHVTRLALDLSSVSAQYGHRHAAALLAALVADGSHSSTTLDILLPSYVNVSYHLEELIEANHGRMRVLHR